MQLGWLMLDIIGLTVAVGLVVFDTEESSDQPPERFDESFPDTEISLMTVPRKK